MTVVKSGKRGLKSLWVLMVIVDTIAIGIIWLICILLLWYIMGYVRAEVLPPPRSPCQMGMIGFHMMHIIISVSIVSQ